MVYSTFMSFNHYARLKRIIDEQPDGWYIQKIHQSTQAKNFQGDVISFPFYYRLYSVDDEQLKYGKFQQLDRLASILDIPVAALPVRDSGK